MDLWAYHNQVQIDFSRPGKPTDGARVELLNGTLRAECVNVHWFRAQKCTNTYGTTQNFTWLYQLFTPCKSPGVFAWKNEFPEANVIKRLHPIVFVCLLVAPLLLAQDSESNNSQTTNIGG